MLPSKELNEFVERANEGGRKSISVDEIREKCIPIKESFPIRIPYLDAVDILIERKARN